MQKTGLLSQPIHFPLLTGAFLAMKKSVSCSYFGKACSLFVAILFFCLCSSPTLAQYATGSLGYSLGGMILSNEFSKEKSLYGAKSFAMQKVLGVTETPEKFEMWALAAATSGELTSLVYKCSAKQKEGMVLAFFGNQWNEAGVLYKAYAFKDLPKAKAVELLDKLEATIETNSPYLRAETDNNNVYFKYDDMTFLVYADQAGIQMRVFWGQFDSEWNISSFQKTKRRLGKKI